MYYALFHSITEAIQLLQEAQKQTEETFISADDPQTAITKSEESENSLSVLMNK